MLNNLIRHFLFLSVLTSIVFLNGCSKPTTLNVNVVLSKSGDDVTHLVDVEVKLSDGYELPSDTRRPLVYKVEPGQQVTVEVESEGEIVLTQSITTVAGQNDANLELDAALANVSFAEPLTTAADLSYSRTQYGSSYSFPVGVGQDSRQILTTPGDLFLRFKVGNLSALKKLTMAPGESVSAEFDGRVSDVTFNVPGWPHAQMPLAFAIADEYVQPPTKHDESMQLLFGEHKIRIDNLPPIGMQADIHREQVFDVVINSAAQTVELAVPYQTYHVSAKGLPDELPSNLNIAVIETTYKGEMYVEADYKNEKMSLPFLNLWKDEAPEFAVAIRSGSKVLGMVPVGGLATGTETDVTVEYGTGLELCRSLYDDSGCL